MRVQNKGLRVSGVTLRYEYHITYALCHRLSPCTQDGKGPCAGLPAKSEDEEEHKGEKPKQRTFSKWVCEGLPDNPWVRAVLIDILYI